MTAEAFVEERSGAYFTLARKVMSPGPASLMPFTARMTVFPSPVTVPPTRRARSSSVTSISPSEPLLAVLLVAAGLGLLVLDVEPLQHGRGDVDAVVAVEHDAVVDALGHVLRILLVAQGGGLDAEDEVELLLLGDEGDDAADLVVDLDLLVAVEVEVLGLAVLLLELEVRLEAAELEHLVRAELRLGRQPVDLLLELDHLLFDLLDLLGVLVRQLLGIGVDLLDALVLVLVEACAQVHHAQLERGLVLVLSGGQPGPGGQDQRGR